MERVGVRGSGDGAEREGAGGAGGVDPRAARAPAPHLLPHRLRRHLPAPHQPPPQPRRRRRADRPRPPRRRRPCSKPWHALGHRPLGPGPGAQRARAGPEGCAGGACLREAQAPQAPRSTGGLVPADARAAAGEQGGAAAHVRGGGARGVPRLLSAGPPGDRLRAVVQGRDVVQHELGVGLRAVRGGGERGARAAAALSGGAQRLRL
mmetsp:Transcript_14908/g.35086  ORF Transcript_14908/g.35086 Transcript_14908/m.35086 type:complete len:207 (+) Transcript_14908:1199-1819(+)